MKKTFSILLIAAVSFAFGQKNELSLSGKVMDCRETKSLKDVIIKLMGNDNSIVMTLSDSLGNYTFNNCFSKGIEYALSAEIGENIGRGPAVRYGVCDYTHYEKSGYENSRKKYTFTYSDTTTKSGYDFCFYPSNLCVWITLPDFYFKKNSTDFESIELGNTKVNQDTTIDCLVGALMARKTWVLEISGHASSDETNKKELSEARAQRIVNILVSKGINPERIKHISYGDSRPIEFIDEWGKLIQKDKNTTNEKSRRVYFSVLSRNFGVEKETTNKEAGK